MTLLCRSCQVGTRPPMFRAVPWAASWTKGWTASWSLVFIVTVVFTLGLSVTARSAVAQGNSVNYDEQKVPEFDLPDPLRTDDGRQVTTPELWWQVRRPELVELFEREVYGRTPGRPATMHFELLESGKWGEKADRKQIRVHFTDVADGPHMDMLVYLPSDRREPVPLFLGLNFAGNHSITDDPQVLVPGSWVRNNERAGITNNRATPQTRGTSASRWPVDLILGNGYGLATIYYGDIDPDFDDGFRNGVHPLFFAPGQTTPKPDDGGSIAAWAWGLSRALDYFERDDDVDAQRVAVVGHSRLGKTALWAGARDQRFAMVVSNDSGCGGAALSRRRFGETVAIINKNFPHWFCDNFNKYSGHEDLLPVDQHELVALVAPRPVLVCSASEDRWADPRGEFLSAKLASPVYRLLGYDALGADDFPPPGKLIGQRVGYYLRAGGHDMTREDWQAYLDFAGRQKGVRPRFSAVD